MKKKGLEKFSIIFMWVLLILFFISFTAHAAVPQKVSYQGYLTDSGGNPVNGPVSIVFYIYNVNAGGAALWSETQSVAVNNGIYSVILGSVTPINLQFNEQYYLGVKVGADAEMTPMRIQWTVLTRLHSQHRRTVILRQTRRSEHLQTQSGAHLMARW